ncbi:MAG: hypothetical protein AAF542_12770 [Pseudomonadota bacterium]
MDYSELLIGIAEIAVALAGFTGVVVVFGSRKDGTGRSAETGILVGGQFNSWRF